MKSGGMGGKDYSDVLQIKIGFRDPYGEVRVGGVLVSWQISAREEMGLEFGLP